jgi:hypothetical protein
MEITPKDNPPTAAAQQSTQDQMQLMMKQYDQGVRMECVRQAVTAKPQDTKALAQELYDFVMGN